MAFSLMSEGGQRRIRKRREVRLGDWLQLQVRLEDGGAFRDRDLREPHQTSHPAASQCHVRGCPGIAHPMDLSVGSHQVTVRTLNDDGDRRCVRSAGLAAVDGQQMPALRPESEAHEASGEKVHDPDGRSDAVRFRDSMGSGRLRRGGSRVSGQLPASANLTIHGKCSLKWSAVFA